MDKAYTYLAVGLGAIGLALMAEPLIYGAVEATVWLGRTMGCIP